jgi:hypothetical protein
MWKLSSFSAAVRQAPRYYVDTAVMLSQASQRLHWNGGLKKDRHKKRPPEGSLSKLKKRVVTYTAATGRM